ncbi:hypothetical protein EKL97_10565 [Flavobacterium sp. LS1P28]|uniref:hypothetical protein n=1 Tax=Flavobacterium sp. LS1P28 TaxID=2497752 RepID=UPI000F82B896|nr:hypothetical protein [Flavobacterium sp. LS1P28]RTY80699.1 hypothetical protein EKL97_10565 [Flavobacterium sp. LS1P28]
MRAQIGFKVTDNKLAVITPEQEMENKFGKPQELTFEEVLELKGYEQGLQLLKDYFCKYSYPLLNGEQRDAFFMDKLRKTRERFFEPI